VSRQKQRPTVGGGSAEVVSIGIGGTHRPDYSRLACGQVAATRRVLELDLNEFTQLINDLTGWDVLPSAVAAWEDDVTPPGDVVLACFAATQGTPSLTLPLLAAVPPAFPAEALAGPWVTSYEFPHAGKPHYHADIAHIAAEGNRILAVNYPPEPRSEGRRRPFRNEITASLYGRHLIGEWRNTSDTRYLGTLHLAVLPGEMVMHGRFSGVANDVAVSGGEWKWVRLEPGPNVDLAGIALRDPHELHDLVMEHSQIDAPLTLADIGEER
jgi:hypothetical protein